LKVAKQKEDEGKTVEQKMAERLEALEKAKADSEKQLQRERMLGIGRKMLTDASIPEPPNVEAFVGDDEETTKARFESFIEYQKGVVAEQNKAHDRANGRRVETSHKGMVPSYEQFLALSDDEQRQYSPEEVEKILHGG